MVAADETRLVDRATEERHRLLADVRLRDRRLEVSDDVRPVRGDVEVSLREHEDLESLVDAHLDALLDLESDTGSPENRDQLRARRGR